MFTLTELYMVQPAEVLDEHVDRLMIERLIGMHTIDLYQLEQKDREVGLDVVPQDFDELHEALEDVSNEQIAQCIEEQRERMGRIIGHLGVIRQVRLKNRVRAAWFRDRYAS